MAIAPVKSSHHKQFLSLICVLESFPYGLQRGRTDLCSAVILRCWCLLWLDQAEMQDSEDSVLLEHPIKLANTWKRGAMSVFGAIAVLAGEAISISLPESLTKGLQAVPATHWIEQTSLDRRRLV